MPGLTKAQLLAQVARLQKSLKREQAARSEALEQQTATSEILRVISSSPTDVQPVFDTIVQSAGRLCGAESAAVYRFEGEMAYFVAGYHFNPETIEAYRREFPRPLRETDHLQRLVNGSVLNIADIQNDPHTSRRVRDAYRSRDARSTVLVPMVREDRTIGAIGMSHHDLAAFSDERVDLLKTFADQAVIAVENVRLFNETKAALEQQTATAEILKVISSSPTDAQPVFDSIVRSTLRLCDAKFCVAYRYDGEQLHVVAHDHLTPEMLALLNARYPQPPSLETATGVSTLERRVVHIPDASADDLPLASREFARQQGWGSMLAVPLLRDGQPVGNIAVSRVERKPFTEQQIGLVQTFADQAVIAIENVRLFKELEARNRDLTTALDTQTAASDILRVISQAQTDVQPVFDAIVASAVRLLGAYTSVMTRIKGDQIALAALTSTDDAGDAALRALYPQSLHSEGAHAQAIRDRAPFSVADAHTDPRLPEAARLRARGYRSQIVVPLLRHEEAIGAIGVTRREPGGFSDEEIALLKTFADQAVIAIENARLLTELQARTQELTRSVEQLTALGDVGRAVSSSLDLDTVLTTIVSRANQLAGADGGSVYEYDEQSEAFHLRATDNLDDEVVVMARRTPVPRSEGVLGRMAVTRAPVQVPDIGQPGAYRSPLRDVLLRTGTRALLAIPLLREDHLIGGLTVNKKTPGEFPPEVIDLLKTFASQSALTIQNARLFRELADKSRQLEVASQHKSEFLANMSHELRTPLNAIIGFSEVLTERMFGELNEKQEEYLRDIYASGTHLLSLINDILDLSKIEAGRMELELTDFDLPTAIDNALTLVRERAGRRGVTLHKTVDDRLGQIRADERKIRQVVLNLLSNAIKFTPEGGRIVVTATPGNDAVEVSVSDTGVGIAPEDQEAVFEEFRQVGGADKKAEGTGLGLALCRKFVELHGGRIWVRSKVGAGSTFTFMLPLGGPST